MSNGDEEGKLRAIINHGGDIGGAAVGGALGFLAGGPAGAAAGAAGGAVAAAAIKKVGAEAASKFLGSREKARVGGALAIAAENIRARVERGETLRTDGFFEDVHFGRSDAEEVVENVLLKAQREAEERKVSYMAFLLGNTAFDAEVSAHLAHQIVKTAEALTYRQFCLLKLIAIKGSFSLRAADYRQQGRFDRILYEVLYECMDLYSRGLISFGGSVAFGPTDVNPASMNIQGLGADIFNLMGLARIPQQDVQPIATRLSS